MAEIQYKIVEDFCVDGVYINNFQLNRIRTYTKSGKLYWGIVNRCRAGGATQKNFPTYEGCTMSENFKDYQYFATWCQKQVGYAEEGFEIDKDILGCGKEYSEQVCVFVPKRINTMLAKSKKQRGISPIGVIKRGSKFHSRCSIGGGKNQHLGVFNTAEEAFIAYKIFKEKLVKGITEEFKERIDSRVYNTLMKYEVNIGD